jgi:hypothetical protein
MMVPPAGQVKKTFGNPGCFFEQRCLKTLDFKQLPLKTDLFDNRPGCRTSPSFPNKERCACFPGSPPLSIKRRFADKNQV